MKNIKFYGGPIHGRTECIPDDLVDRGRYEVQRQAFKPATLWADPTEVGYNSRPPVFDRTVYYFKVYNLAETTKAGARVRKTLMVALLEGADLTHREMYDMENDMEKLPWEWYREPSFLHEFEAWWEKQLHVRGVKKVHVRW